MAAGDLEVGDLLRDSAWELGTVTDVETVAEPQVMYNFTVDEAHTYFVGDDEWLVHNACKFDWVHIFKHHAEWGEVAQQRGWGIFEGLNESQIRGRVQAAWKGRKLIETQRDLVTGEVRKKYRGTDPRSRQTIEFWYNATERIVKTAYPANSRP